MLTKLRENKPVAFLQFAGENNLVAYGHFGQVSGCVHHPAGGHGRHGAFAVVKLGEVNAISTELRERWLPGSQALGDVHAFVSQYRIKQSAHDRRHIRRHEDPSGQADARGANRHRHPYARRRQIEPDARRKAAFDKLKGDWRNLSGQNEQLLRLSDTDAAGAKAMFDGDSLTAFYTVEDDLLALIDLNTKGANAASAHSAAIYDQSRKVIIGAVVGGLAVALGLMGLMMTTIARPVRGSVKP
jgi:methyl-accepting chemotaxis protein